MRPIQWVFPLFLLNQMLAAFLRNDGNPGLATLGVLAGGAFNVLAITFSYLSAGWASTAQGLRQPSAPGFRLL